jgi:hypothetical protein
MKKLFSLLLFVIIIVSCSTIKKAGSETDKNSINSGVVARDGSSMEKAVIIQAKNERAGISAENEWIEKNYPGYFKTMQSLIFNKKRPYDIINIENSEGSTKSIYFNITEFFGKY